MLLMSQAQSKGPSNICRDLKSTQVEKVAEELFERYGDDDGISLEQFADLVKDLHKDYKNVNERSSAMGHHNRIMSMELKAFEQAEAERAAEMKHYLNEFSQTHKQISVFAKSDPAMKARCYNVASTKDVSPTSPYFQDEVSEQQAKLPLSEQYTWDYCCVFKIGDPDKSLIVPAVPQHSTVHVHDKLKKENSTKTVVASEYFYEETARIIASIQAAGLKVFPYLSAQLDEIYVLIGIDELRLAEEAGRVGIDVPLSPEGVKLLGRRYKLDLATNADKLHESVFEGLYGKFVDFGASGDDRQAIYATTNEGMYHSATCFRQVDRLKMIHSVLGATMIQGGADLVLRKNVKDPKHPVVAFFPLHHMPNKEILHSAMLDQWTNVFNPPLRKVKDYFGEELAMYFAYLSFYTKWLIPPSIVGVLFLIIMFTHPNHHTGWPINFDAAGAFGFGLFVCIWSTAFLEAWERQQSSYASEWGMANLKEQEVTRPEFKGEVRKDPITGQFVQTFPFMEYFKRLAVSRAAISTLIAAVIAMVMGQLILRQFLTASNSGNGSLILVALAVLNFVSIQVMNFIYGYVSNFLNDWENHRTDSMYEDARIFKSFVFKCINTYYSFTYIILFKRTFNPEGCTNSFAQQAKLLKDDFERQYVSGNVTLDQFIAVRGSAANMSQAAIDVVNIGIEYRGDCVQELAIQLGVVFMLALSVNNLIEIGIPWVKNKITAKKESAQSDVFKKLSDGEEMCPKSDAENQYEFVQYEGTFCDYDELVLQFGYAVLFVTAFPAVPLLAFINNIVEYRLDATKILGLTRRPIPRGMMNIGYWSVCLTILSWIAIFFIVAITTFSSQGFADLFFEGAQPGFTIKSWLAFVVIEHFLFFVKILVRFFIPDVPADVADFQRRCDLIVASIVERKNV